MATMVVCGFRSQLTLWLLGHDSKMRLLVVVSSCSGRGGFVIVLSPTIREAEPTQSESSVIGIPICDGTSWYRDVMVSQFRVWGVFSKGWVSFLFIERC